MLPVVLWLSPRSVVPLRVVRQCVTYRPDDYLTFPLDLAPVRDLAPAGRTYRADIPRDAPERPRRGLRREPARRSFRRARGS
jgi:hypothetical protein